ncbi:NEDD8 ultimate buster 1-like [Paramisgurnus dabryanus]|uniref:NEDD8 ultimate buster 1-like n=1 Tax=Paramisgurnus dabryanus TaxID=90735 RepID=UPI0031F46416
MDKDLQTSVATLEIKLPQNKSHLKETQLDITAYELKTQIKKEHGIQDFDLIFKGKKLSFEKRLDEQNVKNKSRIMVLPVSSKNRKDLLEYEKEKRSADEGVQRTHRGMQILSERQSTEEPSTTPFLEITDQEGNTLQIPDRDKKALMMAMGFNEKGRALMKNKEYKLAISYLEMAENQFKQCDPTILNALDNLAILQLDIVWCYQRLNERDYLNEAEQRLQNAEKCLQKCYGIQHSRLQQIKKHTGGEDVLLLRLYLLQSCVAFHSHNKKQASGLLDKVQDLYNQLRVDPENLNQLTRTWNFTDREARLGLRACRGNINEAVWYLTLRKEKESEWWRRHLQDVNTLVEFGYSREDAAIALRYANGDLDEAFRILLDRAVGEMGVTDSSLRLIEDLTQRKMRESEKRRHLQDVNRLVEMGHIREDAAVASCYADEASRILLDHKEGQISGTTNEMTEEPDPPSVSMSPDEELANEILKDIPRHVEDYMDLTLEEEQELMISLLSELDK